MSEEIDKFIFSVVIPIYNKEPHLSRAIDSVLNQTDQRFEIIAIDDNSTDDSLAKVQSYKDSRLKIFSRSQPGPGGYAARNLGCKKAQGSWIAFLDADDEWLPDHLSNIRNLIYNRPNIIGGGARWIEKIPGEKPRESRLTSNRKFETFSLQEVLSLFHRKTSPIWTSVAFAQKEYAQNLFPEAGGNRGGDLYAWIFLASKGHLGWSNHVGGIYYRDTANSVTNEAMGSPEMVHDLYSKLKDQLPEDTKSLKRFCNKRIWSTFFANKRNMKENFSLGPNMYWSGDFFYCAKRLMASLAPLKLLAFLRPDLFRNKKKS